MMLNQMSKEQLLHFIDMVSFQCTDTQLYLDSHPADKEAFSHFKRYMELRKSAMSVYEGKFGPLLLDGLCQSECYSWCSQPWPWEGGCQ